MPLNGPFPLYLAGEANPLNRDMPVRNKYSREIATRVAQAYDEEIERAIRAAHEAAPAMAAMKTYQRRAVLEHALARLTERREDLARTLCLEAGKPIVQARGEVARLLDTFRYTAAECDRIEGEVLPLDISERAAGRIGMTRRVPVGPCSLMTPFNFPLNLVAHKVAPAIAAGCPFVLKPSPRTPLGSLMIGGILAETDLPPGAFSVLPCANEDADPLVEDERLKLLSFTGSDKVGWDLKRRAGKKKVLLELGGNAGAIVDETADLDDAVGRLIHGSFYQSGQSCIGVQRIFVQNEVYDDFKQRFLNATRDLKMGDPMDERTFIGPMIEEAAAEKVQRWVRDATDRGGTLLAGGQREGVMCEPTVVEEPPPDTDLYREEAFGPVVGLYRCDTFDQAITRVNDSRFGLQAGVFTRDLYRAKHAWERLEVGGVLVGDVPSWRVDHMPYGGVKDSGLGREGPRDAIEEFTEPRLLVIRE